ncbi:MAG: FG-GAP repeat domain-containing protein, partial [Chitinophagales bacterium]
NEEWTSGAYYSDRGVEGSFFADVTGDGKADAIVVNKSRVYVRRSTGSGFSGNEEWTSGAYYSDRGVQGSFFADVTGDGKADAIVVNKNKVYVRRSTGSGFSGNEEWTSGAYYSDRGVEGSFFADVTGDGKADAIVVNKSKVYVRRSTGSGFSGNEEWTSGAYYSDRGVQGSFFADVTGDGKADAIVVNKNKVYVRRSTGSGFSGNEEWTSGAYYSDRGVEGSFFADVTGDGKADVIVVNKSRVYVRRSTGSGFSGNEEWTSGAYYSDRGVEGSFFSDVTGNRTAAAIVVNKNGVYVVNKAQPKPTPKPNPKPNKVDKTNGHTAKHIIYSFNGKILGGFLMTGDKKWRETSFKNGDFNFTETNRDDWSVYLFDASRKVHIQLDLHTKKVMYSDSKTPRRYQYDIQSATDKSNGRIATSVTFANATNGTKLGEYRQESNKKWVETSAKTNAVTFRFEERGRDDWSIYLLDKSRNVEIQLDLHTQKVMYNVVGQPRRAIYTIVDAK